MLNRPFAALWLVSAIGVTAYAQCGVERWSVKTGTDADVGLVSLATSTATTIGNLIALQAPANPPANNRVQPTETMVFVLNAILTEYKLESDSDYHVVIKDASGNTMITEIPSPHCVGAGSPFASKIANARAQFNAKFTPTNSFQTTSIPVQITGVGFFDFLHGQTGVAPNGVELHPVLDIVFNPSQPTSDFSISAPATLSIAAGNQGTATVSTAVSGGFNSAISLVASGLPAGATSSFSAASIAAPGSGSSLLTINAGATTAPGSDTIVVSGTGGGKTHTANIALTVTSGGGASTTEIITDGGFESATASGLSASGWTATTTTRGNNVIVKGGAYPHAGTAYAQLGGNNSQTDTLTQTVSIASNATAASLTFWANIVTQETGSTAHDKLTVEIHNISGTLLATPLTLSNVDSASSSNTNGTYFQPAAIDLSSYRGQSVQIVFKAVNGTMLPTTFRIDDASLKVTTPGSGSDTTPPTTSITAPANGAMVANSTTISATASDDVGVVKMELYIDGTLTTSDNNSTSLSFSWNTNSVANGSHTLSVKAYDAANNIGTSPAVTVTVSNVSNVQQLLGNPGFENGSSSPAPWTASSGVIDNGSGEPAHSGTWKARLDGYGTSHTDTLSQSVTLPATLTTASLSFWLHIDTAETTTTAYDTLKVQITNSSGTVLATLATYSNLNASSGYVQKSFDVSQYKGQTIKVLLTGVENSTKQTSFVLDDFALNVQ
jgi:hypothetical protein